MLACFVLMGAAILLLALTPSYAAIGVAAPALVVAARLLQGLAVGGDVGPTTAYLLEAAPENRRGFYAALQYASQGMSDARWRYRGRNPVEYSRCAGAHRLWLAHCISARRGDPAHRIPDPPCAARDVS